MESKWTEHDERMMQAMLNTLGALSRYKDFDMSVMAFCENAANWLNSIKKRMTSPKLSE